jgi:hypothetical protein
VRPQLASRRQVIRHDRFVIAALLDRHGQIADDGKAGITTATCLPPEKFWRLSLPITR